MYYQMMNVIHLIHEELRDLTNYMIFISVHQRGSREKIPLQDERDRAASHRGASYQRRVHRQDEEERRGDLQTEQRTGGAGAGAQHAGAETGGRQVGFKKVSDWN